MLTPAGQKLVQETMPLVAALARRTRRRFPEVPLEDFLSLGHEAAVEAARTFDPTRGVPFGGFAFKRIQGAMVREGTTEAFGPLNVALRRAFAEDDDATEPPSELTLDEALEDAPDKARARAVAWIRKQAAAMLLATVKAPLADTAGGEEAITGREDYLRGHAALEEAVSTLGEDERYFVDRHYRDGATFEQIATELGVVKRTVTRMHDRIKARLAERLRERGVTEAPPVHDPGG